MSVQTIGLLTSGGDSPGTNAAVESAARRIWERGGRALGVREGFRGLIDGLITELRPEQIDGIGAHGGSFLKTSRDARIGQDDGRERARGVLRQAGVDGLVVCGGRGSIALGVARLMECDVRVVALPCTIDNDIPHTEASIGFDSACNKAVSLLEAIRETGRAMGGRFFVVETLGGDTGFIALETAYGAWADAVIVPEFEFDLQRVAGRIRSAVEARGYGILVVSEGTGHAQQFTDALQTLLGVRGRATALGHSQRGGPPSMRDRFLGRSLGTFAAEMVMCGESGVMAGMHEGAPSLVTIPRVAADTRRLDVRRYQEVNGLEDPPRMSIQKNPSGTSQPDRRSP